MNTSTDISAIFLKAEQACEAGNWSEARTCYQQIPENSRAQALLIQLDKLEATDHKVREMIKQADVNLEAGQYTEARDKYRRALNHAGEAGILKYHAQLEKQINLAGELYGWKQKVDQELKEADRLSKDKGLSVACTRLEQFLQQEPEGKKFQAISAPLQEKKQKFEDSVGDEEHCAQAQQAFKQQNYSLAIRLAKLVPSTSVRFNSARRILEESTGYQEDYVLPAITRVEKAYQNKLWHDAVAELQALKDQLPDNPDRRQWWLKVCKAQGEDALNNARQANASRKFESAERYFREARDAFEQVVPEYPDNLQIKLLIEEAVDLMQLTAEIDTADKEWQKNERNKARSLLEQTQTRLKHLVEQGRNYTTTLDVVTVMHNTIEKEIVRIREEENWLNEGERLFKEKYLEQAATQFEKAVTALLVEHQRWARQGLDKSSKELDRFKEEMEQGRTKYDSNAFNEAVTAFRSAYQRFPTGPGVLSALEAALEKAGTTAWEKGEQGEKGQKIQALEYFKQIKDDLKLQNATAEYYLAQDEIEPQVELDLKRWPEQLTGLLEKPDLTGADFEPILEDLSAAIEKTRNFKELNKKVSQCRQTVKDNADRWKTFEKAYTVAQQLKNEGQWDEAIEKYQHGLVNLGERQPHFHRDQLVRWRDIWHTIQSLQDMVAKNTEQAETIYGQLAEVTNFDPILGSIRTAQQALQSAENEVSAVGGSLPNSFMTYNPRLNDLSQRVAQIQAAYKSPQIWDALSIIQAALERWTDDSTLKVIHRNLQGKIEANATAILDKARQAIDSNQLDEANDLLNRVSDLHINDTERKDLFHTLQRRSEIQTQLKEVEADVQAKLANSGIPAVCAAQKKGLREIVINRSDIPDEAKKIVTTLFTLEKGGKKPELSGMAFGTADVWEQVQDMLSSFSELTGVYPFLEPIYSLLEEWANNAKNVALDGLIDSYQAYGDLEKAYEAANQSLAGNPGKEEILVKHAAAQEKLLNSTYNSIKKRFDRAQDFMKNGHLDNALADLGSIQEEFLNPLDKKYKGLLEKRDEIIQLRDQAEILKQEVTSLKNQEELIKPQLSKADSLLVALSVEDDGAVSGLHAIQLLLESLTIPVEAVSLQQYLQKLQETLGKKSTDYLVFTIRQKIDRLRKQFMVSEDIAGLKPIKTDLDTLRLTEDWYLLPHATRESINIFAAQVEQKIDALEQQSQLTARLDQAKADGKFTEAVGALEKLLSLTDDPQTKRSLQEQLYILRQKALHQQEQTELLAAIKANFSTETFIEAHTLILNKPKNVDIPVEGLLKVAQVGANLQKARQCRQSGNISDTEIYLTQVLNTFELHNLPAEMAYEISLLNHIGYLANSLKQEIDAIKNRQQQISQALREAQYALSSGDLGEAQKHVAEALLLDSQHKDALAMQTQIELRYQNQTDYEKARQKFTEGDYQGADGLVQAILNRYPNDGEAMGLRKKIQLAIAGEKEKNEVRIEINKIINKVDLLARDRKFQEARQLLMQANDRGASDTLIKAKQTELDEMEGSWRSETILPIQAAFRDGKFSEALARCQTAFKQVASDEVRRELENWQVRIINQWSSDEATALRTELSKPQNNMGLMQIAARIERLLNLEPKPPYNLIRELDELKRETEKRQKQELEREFEKQIAQLKEEVNQGIFKISLEKAEKMRQEARDRGLLNINHKLAEIQLDIEDRIEQQEYASRKEERDQLLIRAGNGLLPAATRRQITDGLDSVRNIFKISGFEGDAEAGDIKEALEKTLVNYDVTEQTLGKVNTLIQHRRFSEANQELDKIKPVPLFEELYGDLRILVDLLRKAENDQDRRDWGEALAKYRRIISMDSTLTTILESDMERCRNKLMDKVAVEAQEALDAIPPRPAEAREILARAREADWFAPAYNEVVSRLNERIASEEKIEAAIVSLQTETPDPGLALGLLGEATRLLPEGAINFAVPQWETFAHAIQSFQAGELGKALSSIESIQSPIADMVMVRRMRSKIEEALKRSEQLYNLERDVHSHLKAKPRRYQQAVDTLISARLILSDDPRFANFQQDIVRELTGFIEDARHEDQYALAIETGESLRQLVEGEEKTRVNELVKSLENERQQTLNSLFGEITIALAEFRLDDDLSTKINRADKIAAPKGHSQLELLKKTHLEAKACLQTVNNDLDEIERLRGEDDLPNAVAKLEIVQKTARTYSKVTETTNKLHTDLQQKIEAELNRGAYHQGLQWCDLALQLGPNAVISNLQAQIEAEQRRYLALLIADIESALDDKVWNLDKAEDLLRQGEELSPGHETLQQLKDKQAKMKTLLPMLQTEMPKLWITLNLRNYPDTRHLLKQLRTTAPNFYEARLWQQYADILEKIYLTLGKKDYLELENLLEQLHNLEKATKELTETLYPAWISDVVVTRKDAAWNAMELIKQGEVVFKCYQSYNRIGTGSADEIKEKLNADKRLTAEINKMLERHQQIIPAPIDFEFSAWRQKVEQKTVTPSQPVISEQPVKKVLLSELGEPETDPSPTVLPVKTAEATTSHAGDDNGKQSEPAKEFKPQPLPTIPPAKTAEVSTPYAGDDNGKQPEPTEEFKPQPLPTIPPAKTAEASTPYAGDDNGKQSEPAEELKNVRPSQPPQPDTRSTDQPGNRAKEPIAPPVAVAPPEPETPVRIFESEEEEQLAKSSGNWDEDDLPSWED